MTVLRLLRAALVVLVLGAGPAAAQMAARPSVDDLVRYFDTIVFGSELDPALASTVVAKWDGEVGIFLDQRFLFKPRYAEFLTTHLNALAKLTRLRFKQVSKPGANTHGIDFIFVKRADMGKLQLPAEYRAAMEKGAAGGCYFLTFKKPESRIVKSIVVVDAERDEALTNSCLLEETTQSLGLPNDSDLMRPSIFSDHDTLFELSPADAILVRTLYDPRMKAGLPRAQALAVARTIITGLTAGGR